MKCLLDRGENASVPGIMLIWFVIPFRTLISLKSVNCIPYFLFQGLMSVFGLIACQTIQGPDRGIFTADKKWFDLPPGHQWRELGVSPPSYLSVSNTSVWIIFSFCHYKVFSQLILILHRRETRESKKVLKFRGDQWVIEKVDMKLFFWDYFLLKLKHSEIFKTGI